MLEARERPRHHGLDARFNHGSNPLGRCERLGPLDESILPLHLDSDPLPAVTSLAAYYDESIRENVHVVAGYLAPTAIWDDVFAPKWRELLRWATVPSSPLLEYKASHCARGAGAFAGMPEADRMAVTDAATDIIVEVCATGQMVSIAAVMVEPGVLDSRGMKPRTASKMRYAIDKHGYGHCLGWCLHDTLKWGMQIVGDDSIQPVFDRRDGFYEVIAKNWKAIVEYMGPDCSARVNAPLSRDSSETVALQAADLLAYETQVEAWYRMTDYPASHVLKRLVATDTHRARVLTIRIAHGGIIDEIGGTPYLYKPQAHIRSPFLWHGQFFDRPRHAGQKFNARGEPIP